jgi:hypothetical protein
MLELRTCKLANGRLGGGNSEASERLIVIFQHRIGKQDGAWGCRQGRRRRKSMLTTPKRASATATSLWGSMRATNKGTGSRGGARKQRAWKKNFIVTITRNQSRKGWNTWNGTSSLLSAGEAATA